MKRYQLEEKIFGVLMRAATFIILLSLIWIISTIVYKGLPYLTWSMVSEAPGGGLYSPNPKGGILNSILGSLALAGGSTVLALFISLPVALYLNVYRRKKSKFAIFIRTCLDILWGIPSIVYGAFGFTLMLEFGFRSSLLAGIITLTLLIIPIMIRAMDEVMLTIPRGLLDASYSLGATKFETAWKVAIKKTMPGIVTAILISFGRAIGDAASVMLTVGYSSNLPTSLFESTGSLPLAIYNFFNVPYANVQGRAYASALILTIIILLISAGSRYFTKSYLKNKI